MKENIDITILTGGVGREKEISLLTGKALYNSLKKTYNTSILELHSEDLPDCKNLMNGIVFRQSTEHLVKMEDYKRYLTMRD